MLHLYFFWQSIQHQAVAWAPTVRDYAVAIGIVLSALAVAYIAPRWRTKLTALGVAASVIITTIAYGVGQKRGADRVKADWDWTLELENREGEHHRTEAERTVHVEPADGGVLRDDPWNRDAQPAARGGAQGR